MEFINPPPPKIFVFGALWREDNGGWHKPHTPGSPLKGSADCAYVRLHVPELVSKILFKTSASGGRPLDPSPPLPKLPHPEGSVI